METIGIKALLRQVLLGFWKSISRFHAAERPMLSASRRFGDCTSTAMKTARALEVGTVNLCGLSLHPEPALAGAAMLFGIALPD
jgi:hypothetical protein